MFLDKIGSVVLFWPECSEIRMTSFTSVRRLDPVVTGRARCHRRKIFLRGKRSLIESLVTGFARNLLIVHMKFVIEHRLSLRVLEGDVSGLVIAGMTVGTII